MSHTNHWANTKKAVLFRGKIEERNMRLFDNLEKDIYSFDVNFADKPELTLKVVYRYENLNLDDELFERRHFFDAEAYLDYVDASPVGTLSFEIRPSKLVFLDEISVAKEFRRQGIGSKMLEFMENVVKEKDCTMVGGIYSALSSHNKRFYKKNGYKIYNKSPDAQFISKNITDDVLTDNVIYSNLEKVHPIQLEEHQNIAEQEIAQ